MQQAVHVVILLRVTSKFTHVLRSLKTQSLKINVYSFY